MSLGTTLATLVRPRGRLAVREGAMMGTATLQPWEGTTSPNGTSEEESIIAQGTVSDGTLHSAGNLRIQGQAKGEIHCAGTLTIEEGARVDARVVAGQITVAGTLTGEITCHGRLQLLPSGRLAGRTATATLAIQEGAIYEGELRMANGAEELGATP